jgi:hypothetical protein
MIKIKLKEAKNRLDILENKFKTNEYLNIIELEDLGYLYLINNNFENLSDERFNDFNFYQLYLVYANDLTFNSKFYKINHNKSVQGIVDYNKIKEINDEEFNSDTAKEMEYFRIENDLIIPKNESEIAEDKGILEKTALYWAGVCLKENHSDINLKIISKETRYTLRKRNIEDFCDNKLNYSNRLDIFKGLLKSYYVFNEATKIITNIEANYEMRKFCLNNIHIELNFYSLVHILTRHYGQLVSSENMSLNKTFHNTKIEPRKIHIFMNYFFNKIKEKGIENCIKIKSGVPILLSFHKNKYAIFPKNYKLDKSKIIIETFFTIEKENDKSHNFFQIIEKSEIIKLDDNLFVYIQ